MGEGVAEAERERELSKQALAAHASALDARVRNELDWRARLQRDGLRYAVIGTVTLAITVSVVVLRSGRCRKESPPVTATSLEDVAARSEAHSRPERPRIAGEKGAAPFSFSKGYITGEEQLIFPSLEGKCRPGNLQVRGL